MTKATAIARYLKEKGAPVFTLLGATISPVLAALGREAEELVVPVCNEFTASTAADGYARASGEPAVVLVSGGPGAVTAAPGIADAYESRFPMVVLVGQEPTEHDGREVVHHCEHINIFEPITVAQYILTHNESARGVLDWAFERVIRSRQGPVLIELPRDVQESTECPASPIVPTSECYFDIDVKEELGELASMIRQSRKPAILAGGGIVSANAWPFLRKFAEKIGAAVLLTHTANGVIPPDHPCYAGMAPMPHAREIWENADLLIAIGTRLPSMCTNSWQYPRPPKVVHIDEDHNVLGTEYEPDLTICDDAWNVLSDLVGRDYGEHALWHVPPECPLGREMRLIADALEEEVPQQRVLALGLNRVGSALHVLWNRAKRPRRLIRVSGFDLLGTAFGFGIGAYYATKEPPVWVSGDGEFLFNLSDLGTMRRLPVGTVGVIVCNGTYEAVREFSMRAQNSEFCCRVPAEDIPAICRALGFDVIMSNCDSFRMDLRQALSADRHTIICLQISGDA